MQIREHDPMQPHLHLPPDVAARLAADRDLLLGLRAAIARRIERDMMILDALCPDPDLEDGDAESDADAEATAAEWSGRGVHRFTRGVTA